MRRYVVLISLWFASLVSAQTSGKFAYVDTLKLLNAAPQRAAVEARLRQENRKMQETLSQMRGELSTLQKQLENETDEAKRNALEQQILDRQTLITRRSDAIQETFLLKRNDAISAFQKEINDVIAEVAQRKDLDGVLTQASVVYFHPRIDITEEVMQALKLRFEQNKQQTSTIRKTLTQKPAPKTPPKTTQESVPKPAQKSTQKSAEASDD